MAMECWEPFRNMTDIQGEVNRLFDNFFGRPTASATPEGRSVRPSSTSTRRRTISS